MGKEKGSFQNLWDSGICYLLQNKLVLALPPCQTLEETYPLSKGSCKYGKNPTSKNEVQKKLLNSALIFVPLRAGGWWPSFLHSHNIHIKFKLNLNVHSTLTSSAIQMSQRIRKAQAFQKDIYKSKLGIWRITHHC